MCKRFDEHKFETRNASSRHLVYQSRVFRPRDQRLSGLIMAESPSPMPFITPLTFVDSFPSASSPTPFASGPLEGLSNPPPLLRGLIFSFPTGLLARLGLFSWLPFICTSSPFISIVLPPATFFLLLAPADADAAAFDLRGGFFVGLMPLAPVFPSPILPVAGSFGLT